MQVTALSVICGEVSDSIDTFNLNFEPRKCFFLCFKKTADLNSQLRRRRGGEWGGRKEGEERERREEEEEEVGGRRGKREVGKKKEEGGGRGNGGREGGGGEGRGDKEEMGELYQFTEIILSDTCVCHVFKCVI